MLSLEWGTFGSPELPLPRENRYSRAQKLYPCVSREMGQHGQHRHEGNPILTPDTGQTVSPHRKDSAKKQRRGRTDQGSHMALLLSGATVSLTSARPSTHLTLNLLSRVPGTSQGCLTESQLVSEKVNLGEDQ